MQRRIQLHLAEGGAIDAGNAVMLGQALVHIGVVGVQEIQRAAVVAHHAVEEHLGFGLHRLAQAHVEIREGAAVGLLIFQPAQIEPLAGEILASAPWTRGSASMRATCAFSTAGLCSWFFCATDSSASSGMLLHRKKDRRVRQFQVADAVHRARRAAWPDRSRA